MASEKPIPMLLSGFCLFPGSIDPERAHTFCTRPDCECECHKEEKQ